MDTADDDQVQQLLFEGEEVRIDDVDDDGEIETSSASREAAQLIQQKVRQGCLLLRSNDMQISELDLRNTPLNASLNRELISALSCNTTLVRLEISGTVVRGNHSSSIIDDFAEHILPMNPSLQELSICTNYLEDITSIAKALAVNTSLLKLNLFDNRIGDDGAEALAKMMCENRSLEKLDLFKNRIGDKGCIAIAKALRINTSLTWLDLRWNQVTSKGAAEIEAALQDANYTMEGLCLGENDVPIRKRRNIIYLCNASKRLRRKFLQVQSGQDNISLALWPYALQCVSQKPGLLFAALRSKPELCIGF